MRIVGVIAEYNPFHSGHAHHLDEARRRTKADSVVAVMSGCFVQRGDAAILSPAVRAEMALKNGADAVLLLPAMWSVRNAEHFALGGVSLLNSLGCDCIAFGAETADSSALSAAANLLETDATVSSLHAQLARGLPYPAALSAAISDISPEAATILASPNNTLAVCYLRAMTRLRSAMSAVPILRESNYHASAISGALSSAAAIRSAILRGDWQAAQSAMPESAINLLMNQAAVQHLHRPEALDLVLLSRLRTMSDEDFAHLPDLSEGIENRLRRAANAAVTRESLLQAAKTRRYPYARLSRLATYALLGITADLLTESPLPPAAVLLGYRRDCTGLLSQLSHGQIPLLSPSACNRHDAWFQIEERAWQLWALGAGLPGDLLLRYRVISR